MFNNDQNDENFGVTDEGDEDDFAPGTTCLTSPAIEQFSEDERENKTNPQRYSYYTFVGSPYYPCSVFRNWECRAALAGG